MLQRQTAKTKVVEAAQLMSFFLILSACWGCITPTPAGAKMAIWHGLRGLDHLLRRPCDLAQQLSHMQQIQLAGACQVCTLSVSQPQMPIQASLPAQQIRLRSLSTWRSDREFMRTWDHGSPSQAAAQPWPAGAQRWPQQAMPSLPLHRCESMPAETNSVNTGALCSASSSYSVS